MKTTYFYEWFAYIFFAHVSFINEAQWLFYGWMYINDNIRSFLNSSF